jgi:hypothetical protein
LHSVVTSQIEQLIFVSSFIAFSEKVTLKKNGENNNVSVATWRIVNKPHAWLPSAAIQKSVWQIAFSPKFAVGTASDWVDFMSQPKRRNDVPPHIINISATVLLSSQRTAVE